MGDTETEKTRNPIPWICGLGAVWLSVGVARGCEDPRILEWFPGWGEKGKLRGIFVTELRHFQHFNRRHQRMSHKLQILQEFYLHISSVVDCPTFSTLYDVLNLYFWKLFLPYIIFIFYFLSYIGGKFIVWLFSGCTMSWMGGLGWKEGLSGVQMQKVKFSINEYNYAKTLSKWQLFTSGGGAWEESKQSSWSKPAEAAAAWLPQPGAGEDQEEGKQGLLHLSPFEGSNIRKLVLNRYFRVGLGSGGCAWYMTQF